MSVGFNTGLLNKWNKSIYYASFWRHNITFFNKFKFRGEHNIILFHKFSKFSNDLAIILNE